MRTTLTLAMITLLFLAGCKKDDNKDDLAKNYFTIDGTSYSLDNGYLTSGKIYLMSKALTIAGLEQTTGNPIYKGSGSMVSFTGIGTEEEITPGTYPLADVAGDVYIYWDPALTTFDYHSTYHQAQGNCAFGLQDTQATVEAAGILEDGRTFTVKYSGTLSVVGN